MRVCYCLCSPCRCCNAAFAAVAAVAANPTAVDATAVVVLVVVVAIGGKVPAAVLWGCWGLMLLFIQDLVT